MTSRLQRFLNQEINVEGTWRRIFGPPRSREKTTKIPDFRIEPCDALVLSEEEPLVAPSLFNFRVNFPDESVVFLARKVSFASGGQEIWIKRQAAPATLRLHGLSAEADAQAIVNYYDKNVWTRWILLDENFQPARHMDAVVHRVFLLKGGTIYWAKTGTKPYQFKLTEVPERYRWSEYYSTSEIARLIRKQVKDPRSDCAFCFRWSNLSITERNEWIYHTESETFAECQRILQLWMLTGDWWERAEEMVCVFDDLPSENNSVKARPNPLEDVGVRPVDDEHGWVETSSVQRRMLAIVDQHFGLYYDEECRQHQQLGLKRPHCWYLSVKQPTFHERLEARLQLRDWLRDKVSPEELASLF